MAGAVTAAAPPAQQPQQLDVLAVRPGSRQVRRGGLRSREGSRTVLLGALLLCLQGGCCRGGRVRERGEGREGVRERGMVVGLLRDVDGLLQRQCCLLIRHISQSLHGQ